VLVPGQFLPCLEADRRQLLARHVIRHCIRDLAADPWLPPLSVNLDPDVAQQAWTAPLIQDELALWQVEPARLVVEITENGVMSHSERLLESLGRLRRLGVRIAMDDFGTGQSSLGQFRHLPVDELKIHRSFVTGLDTDESSRYLAGLMIDLGHHFGMTVVAEGVETQAAAEVLETMSCDALQGFLYAPPLPLEEFTRWAAGRPGASR
jgi:EAL domain-containing protein (putative c-di-GMP-specific phosphodiesterase class I)